MTDKKDTRPLWRKIWDADTDDHPKFLSISEAVKLVNEAGIDCSPVLMTKWCRTVGIGWKFGGRWYIRVKKLIRFLDEEPVFYEDPEQNSKRD